MSTSTSTSTSTTFSIVKDKFAEVITKGMLFLTNKQTDWNVVITKKAILDAMRASSPPEATRYGLATLYDTIFSTSKDCQEFTVNLLWSWGNMLNFKHLNIMYIKHNQEVTRTSNEFIKRS
jgi:hypothetical protein